MNCFICCRSFCEHTKEEQEKAKKNLKDLTIEDLNNLNIITKDKEELINKYKNTSLYEMWNPFTPWHYWYNK